MTVPFDPQAAPITPLGLLRVQQTAGNAAATAVVQRQPMGQVTPATRPTLRYGSTGEDVKVLQMKLDHVRERMHDRGEEGPSRIDGIFGPLTRQDVIDFQADTGLDPDGVVGPNTWNALDTLVPGTPDEASERARNERSAAADELALSGQYEAAIAIYEALLASTDTPEAAGPILGNIGICHQQRGRFGLAVASYERALAGRFNQESMRPRLLRNLLKARRNEFLDNLAPDPEPLPPGAEPGASAREGGGVTERQSVKSGDSGPAVDLLKGKLENVMVAWKPTMSDGDAFDDLVAQRLRDFQAACGLPQTGDGDATTWHALDSFTPVDVPFSVAGPMNDEARKTKDLEPAVALEILKAGRDKAMALGLHEIVKHREGQIGVMHQRLSHFDEAIASYNIFLTRVIPRPKLVANTTNAIDMARRGDPNV